MNAPETVGSPASSPYFTAEHEMLRTTIRRFVAGRVLPHADAWEEAGHTPREILREMGELGLLGIRYASRHGGSELDTLATVVLAEELGRSSYGGFAITVLVHTDMASPPLFHGGTPAPIWPACGRRRAATATGGCSTARRCSSRTESTATSTSSPRRPVARRREAPAATA